MTSRALPHDHNSPDPRTPQRAGSGSTSVPWPLIQWSMIGVALVALVAWGAILSGPVMAGDAYAYFVTSSMRGKLSALYAADPYLQRINNPLFCLLGNWACTLAGGDGTALIRIVNPIAFVAAVWVLVLAVSRQMTQAGQTVLLAILLLMPISSYCPYFMPEATYFLGVAALSWVAVGSLAPLRGWRASGAGALVGLLAATKPHAAAIAIALAAYVMLQHLAEHRLRRGLRSGAFAVAACAVGATVTVLGLNALFHGSLPPVGSGLSGQVYSEYIRYAGTLQFTLGTLLRVLTVHALLMIGVVGVPLMLVLRTAIGGAPPRGNCDSDPISCYWLCVWSLILLLCTLTMSVIFTAILVDREDPSQITRVHGRYYSFAIAVLLTSFFASVHRMMSQPWFPRWAAIASAASGVCMIGYGFAAPSWITVFPWDFPELFGLSRWSFSYQDVSLVTSWSLVGLTCLSCTAILARCRWTPIAIATSIGITFASGTVTVAGWQWFNSRDNGSMTRDALAIRSLIPIESRDRGLVVGEDRYGAMAYCLYGLRSLSRVLQKPTLSTISRADVPAGTEWVLTTDPISVDVPYVRVLETDRMSLYQLAPDPAGTSDGSLRLDLARELVTPLLEGFGKREEWGRWSQLPVCRIHLPHAVAGRLQVELLAWSSGDALQTLKLTIGQGSAFIPLESAPSVRSAVIDSGIGASVLEFSGVTPTRAAPWERPRGVALQYVKVLPCTNPTPE